MTRKEFLAASVVAAGMRLSADASRTADVAKPVADYANAFSDSVERAYPGRHPKLVEVYEKSEYGRVPVRAERELLESLGGVWIDSTDSKWTQVK